MVDYTWTPSLSGSVNDKGINTTNSLYATLQFNITLGNPMIGSTLKELEVTWRGQATTPVSGTWQLIHYQAGIAVQVTQTTATPPTSNGNQVFDMNGTYTIGSGDYFTLSCNESDDSDRNPQFPTQPTCTGDCQWSCVRKTDNVDFNYVPSVWTYSDPPTPPSSSGTRLPPPPAFVRI